ncbi:MAG: hypothetical protein LBG20_02020 [Holosporaceae bacterium]|nr:hypothetical protein [Holosporaceae bacterium]
MKLNKEMIKQIETLHIMNDEELYETYGDMIPDDASENTEQVKLELAYTIYAVLCGKWPNEMKRDLIYCHFQHLEMNQELETYKHSRNTQRIIKRLYQMQ